MLDHELRQRGLGGSEIAAVAGLNPYSNALEVWARKTGRMPEPVENLAMARGTYLEDFIAQQYSNVTGWSLHKGTTRQHPTIPWMVGTPDFYVIGQDRGLEAKHTGYLDPDLWGDFGTDLIPIYFVTQCQWYMHLTGLPRWDVAVDAPRLVEVGIYHLAYDLELVEMLLEIGEEFWTRYVLRDEAPPLDASEATERYLRSRYSKQSLDTFVKADKEAEVWSDTLQMAKAQLKPLEELKTRAENELKRCIGDEAGIEGAGFLHTWKQDKPRKEVDWHGLALNLGATPHDIARFTTEKPGSRRFLTKWIEEKGE